MQRMRGVDGTETVLPCASGPHAPSMVRHPTLAVTLVPIVALLVYLAMLFIRLPQLYVVYIYWNSDATTYMLLSRTLAHGVHGSIYLSNAPWYTTILIDVLTYHMPSYQTIWTLWPAAAYVAGVSILIAAVAHLAGRWAALTTAILCLAPSLPVLLPFLQQAFHELTVITCILLAVFLVRLVEQGADITGRTLLFATALGIFTGANAASDLLLVVIGIIPFVGVALLLLALYRDLASFRTATVCLVTVVVAIGAGCATVVAGNDVSLVPHVVATALISPPDVTAHLELAGGVLFEEIAGAWQYLAVASPLWELVLGVAGLCVILAAVAKLAIQLQRSTPPATVSNRSRALQAHYLIWVAIAAADFGALAFTLVPIDLNAVRYATVLWIAVAAALPPYFARTSTRRIGLAFLVTFLVAMHACALYAPQVAPDANLTAAVAYLESHHVRYGYADYWEANSITWVTNGVLTLRPASSCNDHGLLCATEFADASSWYAPQPGWSAVIVDPNHTLTISPISVYGAPREVHKVGQLTIYVYDHDLGPLSLRPLGY